MLNIALISFFERDISIQTLSAYLKKSGYNTVCFICPGKLNDSILREFIKFLRDKDISLVGMSVNTDVSYSATILTNSIKENNRNISVIWGGPHVNVMPEECLRYADMICMGEGEDALLELVKRNKQADTNIRNIWFKVGSSIIKNDLRNLESNLDRYVCYDHDIKNQYLMNKNGFEIWDKKYLQKIYYIVTSRGCPYNCAYCYNNYRRKQYQGLGRYLRFRSIDNVITELVEAKNKYSELEYIYFCDDVFVIRKIDEIKQFQKLYSSKVGLPFFAFVDPRSFNKEKVEILRDCGLSLVQIGIQSGDECFRREVYNRIVSNDKFLDMAHFINKLGITVYYDIIFNNPYEKIEDIKESIKLAMKLPQPFLIQGYNIIFYPGTDITEKALKDGFISKNSDLNNLATIQDNDDSPLFSRRGNMPSNRYYKVNFNSHEKIYWNKIFVLFLAKYIPVFYRYCLIKFFLRSNILYKRIILNWLTYPYFIRRQIKNKYAEIIIAMIQKTLKKVRI